MKKLLFKTQNMKVFFTTGREGPEHDPYSYRELHVTKDDYWIILHEGLASWVRSDKDHQVDENINPEEMFTKIVGYSPQQIFKFQKKLLESKMKSVCKEKEHHEIIDIEGYPGETFLICQKCNEVFDYSFEEVMVI